MSDFPLELDDVAEAPLDTTRTAPQLAAQKRGEDRLRFDRNVAALEHRQLLTLLPSLETQLDPAMLWPLHASMARRGLAPVLRGPRHQLGEQGDFIELAADIAWLQTEHPDVSPRYRLWKAIFELEPGSPLWWELLQRQRRRSVSADARALTIALGLRDAHRRDLRSIQTASARRLFEDLHGPRFGEFCSALEEEIRSQPDKSGRVLARDAAARRARIYRVHQLSHSTYAGTAELWAKLTGEHRSAQAMREQVLKAEPVFRALRAEWTNRHK